MICSPQVFYNISDIEGKSFGNGNAFHARWMCSVVFGMVDIVCVHWLVGLVKCAVSPAVTTLYTGVVDLLFTESRQWRKLPSAARCMPSGMLRVEHLLEE